MKYFSLKFMYAVILGIFFSVGGISAERPNYDQEKDFFLVKSEIIERLGSEYRGNNFRFNQEALDNEVYNAEYLYKQAKQVNPYQYPTIHNLFYKKNDLVNYAYEKYKDHDSWVKYAGKFQRRFGLEEYKNYLNFSGISFPEVFSQFIEHEKRERAKWLRIYEEVRRNAEKYLLKGPFHPHQITGVDVLHQQGITGDGAEAIVWDCGFVNNCHVSFNLQDKDQMKYPEDGDRYDMNHLHGTHVSGILAAGKFAGVKQRGVAFNASIIPIEYRGIPDLIDRIQSSKTKIISASFDFLLRKTEARDLLKLVEELEKNDRLLVMAAGNNSEFLTPDLMPNFFQYWFKGGWFGNVNSWLNQKYPDFFKRILLVGSLREDGTTVSSFSNLPGSFANNFVFAPGENVMSTVAYNQFDQMSGTSMATPHVSGILTLLNKYNPTLNAVQLKQCLLTTCDPFWVMGNDASRIDYNPSVHGMGRVNAVRAFEEARKTSESEKATDMDI